MRARDRCQPGNPCRHRRRDGGGARPDCTSQSVNACISQSVKTRTWKCALSNLTFLPAYCDPREIHREIHKYDNICPPHTQSHMCAGIHPPPLLHLDRCIYSAALLLVSLSPKSLLRTFVAPSPLDMQAPAHTRTHKHTHTIPCFPLQRKNTHYTVLPPAAAAPAVAAVAVPAVVVAAMDVEVAVEAGTVRSAAGTLFLKPPPMRPPLRPFDLS